MNETPPDFPGSVPAPGVPVRTAPLAIWALVLALVGPFLCAVPSLAAIVVGILACKAIARSGGALTGKGLAIGGIVGGFAGLVAVVVLAVTTFVTLATPAVGSARQRAEEVKAVSDVRQVMLACQLYETDNDGKLPDVPRDLESTGILKPGMLAKVWPHVTWLGAPGTKRDALPPDAVLLRYERERKGGPKIVVVGRVDGTVEQVEPKRKAKAKP